MNKTIEQLQQENNQLKELKYKFFDDCGEEESFTLEDHLKMCNELYDYQQENKQLKESLNSISKTEKALRLLLNWAVECDFGYDNFPEEYERYKKDIENMDYIEGMIYIAKKVIEERKNV